MEANPVVDKSIIAIIVGPIVGLLVMKGYVAPTNADQLTQSIDSVIGGLIALFTIVGYISHHTAIQKQKQSLTTPQVTSTPTTTVNVETQPQGGKE